jgi:aspartate racemase
MRTVGLIGGTSWPSTAFYYRVLNEGVNRALGGSHSARIALWSVDFGQVRRLQVEGDLDGESRLIADAARRLEAAGAGCVVICSNTMHRFADHVGQAVDIPLLHIMDAVGDVLAANGHRQVGVVGTQLALADDDLFRTRLGARHGIDVVLPEPSEREALEAVIESEFGIDWVSDHGRKTVTSVLTRLEERGSDALVLACTALGRIIDASAMPIPTYDSGLLHAQAAVAWALAEDS